MVSANAVKKELVKLLKAADLEVTTERKLTQALVDKFGTDALAHQDLISGTIQDFLQDGGVGGSDADSADDDFENGQTAHGKRKRKAAGADKPAKAAKTVSSSKDFAIELADHPPRRLTVSRYGGSLLIGVRDFYDKDGELCPGKKGISLSVAQWGKLRSAADQVTKAAEEDDRQFGLELDTMRRVTISEFKGRTFVDVREFYEKDGQQLPGKKGISLPVDQWQVIAGALDAIDEAIKQQNGGVAPQPKAPASAAVASGVFASDEPSTAGGDAKAGPSTAGPSGSTAGPSSSGNTAELPVQLSATRRADVSEFKGTKYVNIREYYEKDGQLLPGSKGMSLPAPQFQALRDGVDELSQALQNNQAGFEVPLSAKRKASLSEFKGKYMVNIREYYEKDGKQLPGKKGISLPAEQWTKLTQHLDALSAALTG